MENRVRERKERSRGIIGQIPISSFPRAEPVEGPRAQAEALPEDFLQDLMIGMEALDLHNMGWGVNWD